MEILQTLVLELQHDWPTVVIVCVVVGIAYMSFAVTGYGGGALAAPLLVLRVPLAMVVPLLSVCDFCAATINMSKVYADGGRKAIADYVDFQELRVLSPSMICGTAVGANLLRAWPPHYLLLALGLFVIVTTVRNLLAKPALHSSDRAPVMSWSSIGFAAVAGFVGGLFSGAFGLGGPVYALHISNRIEPAKIAGTLGTLIGIAAGIRALIFLYLGDYADRRIVVLLVAALPFLLLGMLGTHVMARDLPKHKIVSALRYLLLIVGLTILARAIPGFF